MYVRIWLKTTSMEHRGREREKVRKKRRREEVKIKLDISHYITLHYITLAI